jgi:hypothetical protein
MEVASRPIRDRVASGYSVLKGGGRIDTANKASTWPCKGSDLALPGLQAAGILHIRAEARVLSDFSVVAPAPQKAIKMVCGVQG